MHTQSSLESRLWTYMGYLFFVGLMAAGYIYNVTFIQLGLVDLGERLLALSPGRVALYMALLALLTCVVALLTGYIMQRRGWGTRFLVKLRLAFGVVLVQTVLTLVAASVRSELGFLIWIVACSVALGVGVPATFSMTVDLIPTRARGAAAAAVTAVAYGVAPLLTAGWRIEEFTGMMGWLLAGGTVGLAAIAFLPLPPVEQWARQHRQMRFARGRFVRAGGAPRRRLYVFLVLMFGVYFVDSLGFLRLISTPQYVNTAWLSVELSPRVAIAGAHVLAAVIGGVLYRSLNERSLFLWVFGIFALVHLMYTSHVRTGPVDGAPLAMPLLYAVAVSLYTVISFAIWADISTPATISRNAAIGVALSGWTATFISTGLALYWRVSGMPLDRHLNWVDALAMLFFIALLILPFLPWEPLPPRQQTSRSES